MSDSRIGWWGVVGLAVWVGSASAQTEPPPPTSGVPSGGTSDSISPVAASATSEDVAATSAEAVNDIGAPGFWEGGGWRATDSTIVHLGLTLGSTYQTNVFFQDSSDGPSGTVSAPMLRFGVGASWGTVLPARMEISTPSGGSAPQRLTFNLDASLEYDQYLSGNSDISRQSDLGIGFLGDVKVNPEGALSLELRDGFLRSVTPGQSIRENADRDRNELLVQGHFKPGGGALDFYLGYIFVVDVFEASILNYDNRVSHAATGGVRWQWLPRTVVSLDASLATVNPSNETLKASSTPFRVTMGLSTLLTPVLGLIASAGYGNGFYASGENVSTWLATLEIRFALGPTVRTALGYSHDFSDALVGNFYVDHAIYGRLSAQLGARWQARAKAEVRFRDYGGIHDTMDLRLCGDASCGNFRKDILPRVEVGTDYAVLPWLLVGASYIFQADSTDFFVRSTTADSTGRFPEDRSSFVWHEVDVRLQAKW